MEKIALLTLWSVVLVFSGCGERSAVRLTEHPRNTPPVIVHLQTRNEIITVMAGPDGPVYTVRAREGRMLGQRLSERELQAQLPKIYRFLKTAYAGDEKATVIWAGTVVHGLREIE